MPPAKGDGGRVGAVLCCDGAGLSGRMHPFSGGAAPLGKQQQQAAAFDSVLALSDEFTRL